MSTPLLYGRNAYASKVQIGAHQAHLLYNTMAKVLPIIVGLETDERTQPFVSETHKLTKIDNSGLQLSACTKSTGPSTISTEI